MMKTRMSMMAADIRKYDSYTQLLCPIVPLDSGEVTYSHVASLISTGSKASAWYSRKFSKFTERGRRVRRERGEKREKESEIKL